MNDQAVIFQNSGYIIIFKGNTYDCKDRLKELGCKYNSTFGWYLAGEIVENSDVLDNIPKSLSPIKIKWTDISENDEIKDTNEIVAFVDNLLYDKTASEYQGSIGERLDLQIVVIKNLPFEGKYGRTIVHTFEDLKGNHYTWFTSSKSLPVGNSYHIKGTVKSYDCYHNDKTTVLTRCRIV